MLKTISAIAFSLFLFVAPVSAITPPPSVSGIDPMPAGSVYSLSFNARCETSDQFTYSKAEVTCGIQTSNSKITKTLSFPGCLSIKPITELANKECLTAFVPSPTPTSTQYPTPTSTAIPTSTPLPSLIASPTSTSTAKPTISPLPYTTDFPKQTSIPIPTVAPTPQPPFTTFSNIMCNLGCNFIFNASKRAECKSKCGGN